MSKNILVAGGAGYIGSHFCKLAAEKGYTPITIDRLTSPSPQVEQFRRSAVQWGPLEIADIGDEDAVLSIAEKYKPVAAICFASLIEVGESTLQPDLYWDNNYYKVMRFFKTLERGKLRHLVFSSSAAVYGNPTTAQPLNEEDDLAPISPYGMTKLSCEIGLQGLYARQGSSDGFIDEMARRALKLDYTYPEFRMSFFPCLKSVIFRYFNAAGADKSATIGEMHEPETHLIANAVLAAQGKKQFTLNGSDYPTTDGTCIRDYVHVNDLARAHIQGLEYLLAGGKSDVFNLGTGKGYSVQQVIDSVKKHVGDFAITHGPRRTGDPAFLVADASKAKQVLGWEPTYDLDAIIKTAAAFHKDN
ncbi:MAG: UDP-glucose 4-epimerase [Alphaproteobacteria bacterium]|nr:UDP-glucose 4-epimerase [Alphaproteobacteria bacterium]